VILHPKVAVCVLYWGDDPQRAACWRYARARWLRWGFGLILEGDARAGSSTARNRAAAGAAWDVAVFADADVVLGWERQEGGYVCAYSEFARLDRQATADVLAGGPLPRKTARFDVGIWEGCFAIGRPLWEQLGGFDERFAGRAGQGPAFVHAAATLARLERVPGPAYHLWHPPGLPQGRAEDLWPRYRDANGNPAAMRALLAERTGR